MMTRLALLALLLAACGAAPALDPAPDLGVADCYAEPPSQACGALAAIQCRHPHAVAPLSLCAELAPDSWCCDLGDPPFAPACVRVVDDAPGACPPGVARLTCDADFPSPDTACTGPADHADQITGRVWCCL